MNFFSSDISLALLNTSCRISYTTKYWETEFHILKKKKRQEKEKQGREKKREEKGKEKKRTEKKERKRREK